jgi:hypothetical protein
MIIICCCQWSHTILFGQFILYSVMGLLLQSSLLGMAMSGCTAPCVLIGFRFCAPVMVYCLLAFLSVNNNTKPCKSINEVQTSQFTHPVPPMTTLILNKVTTKTTKLFSKMFPRNLYFRSIYIYVTKILSTYINNLLHLFILYIYTY